MSLTERPDWLEPEPEQVVPAAFIERLESLKAEAKAKAHTQPAPWTPAVGPGEVLTLENIVAQALGTGSMCWSETPTGIYDSERAAWILEGAVAAIKEVSGR